MKPSELLRVLRIFGMFYPSVLSRMVEDFEMLAADKNCWVKCGTYQKLKEGKAVIGAAVAQYLYAHGDYDLAIARAEEDESFRIRLGETR